MAPTPSRIIPERARSTSPRNPVQLRTSGSPSSRTPPSHDVSESATQATLGRGELLQLAEARVKELERMQELREQEKTLLAKLGLGTSERGTKRKRSLSQSSDSSGHHHQPKAIKVKNLIRFTDSMNYRRRQEWLQDLERAFSGDPRRFATDSNRILFALDQMDEHPRNRWYSHCRNLSTTDRSIAESTWKTFEDWTKECVYDIADQSSQVAKSMNTAQQRKNQTPWDFHHYLESLEAQLPPTDDKSRALLYYTKLQPALIRHIDLYHTTKPERREDMVRLASQIWHNLERKIHQESVATDSSSPRGRSGRGGRFSGRFNSWQKKKSDTRHHDDKSTKSPQDNDATTSSPHHDAQQSGTQEKRTCYVCGSDQHLSYDCPKNEVQVNNSRGYRGRGRGRYHNSGHNRSGNGRHPR